MTESAPGGRVREFPKVDCNPHCSWRHFIPRVGKRASPTWFNFLRTFLLTPLSSAATGLTTSETLSVTDEWAYVLGASLSALWHKASSHQRQNRHGERGEKNLLSLP